MHVTKPTVFLLLLFQNGVDTTANMILEYSNGRSAMLSSSTDTFMSPQASIHGKKGVIKVQLFGKSSGAEGSTF